MPALKCWLLGMAEGSWQYSCEYHLRVSQVVNECVDGLFIVYLSLLFLQQVLESCLLLYYVWSMRWALSSRIIDDIFLGWGWAFEATLNVLLEEWNLNLQILSVFLSMCRVIVNVLLWCFLRGLCSLFDFLHDEYFVLVELLVHWEFARLAEGLGAAFIGTLEGLLTCVNVGVLLQILGKCECLVANYTDKWFRGLVGGHMSPQRESGRESLVTVFVSAFVGSFHWGKVSVRSGESKVVCYRYKISLQSNF